MEIDKRITQIYICKNRLGDYNVTNVMTNITSRKRVLAFLERNQSATADEIARALRITPANARHHLSQLGGDGLVRETGTRPPVGRGRPPTVYRLGGQVDEEHAAPVLGALLGLLENETGGNLPDGWVEPVSRRLAGPGLVPQGVHITRRLSAATERLNALKYNARWEAHAAGPRIVLGNCPYRSLVEDHPSLCRMDAALLARLTGRGVTQSAKLELNERGLPFCLFLVENQENYDRTHFSPRT